jgi:hypothetical protein
MYVATPELRHLCFWSELTQNPAGAASKIENASALPRPVHREHRLNDVAYPLPDLIVSSFRIERIDLPRALKEVQRRKGE